MQLAKTKTKTDEDILKDFDIKPCKVILERAIFSKIGISCSAHSSDGSILKCTLMQQDVNTISLTVKRKNHESSNDDTLHPSKRLKTNKAAKSKPKSNALVRRISKPQPCKRVEIGEVVLCKMRGFKEWPSYVTGFEKKLVCIQFFGDQTTHKAAVKNFYKFTDSYELLISLLRTNKDPLFSKAVQEAECVLGVVPKKSIFKRI